MTERYPSVDRRGTPYADVSDDEFASWGWQLKHRIDDADGLARLFALTDEERRGLAETKGIFRFACTPYYALLADRRDPTCPIRRQIVPQPAETQFRVGERTDPLGEVGREVVPNLIHRYPDRVLLLATDRCPVYCRFCTRRRIVGHVERQMTRALFRETFDYIKANRAIREVIVSGGDALMMGDNQIAYLLSEIRAITHVDIIRIATRMPATCPMRITPELAKVMRKHSPVYVMTHFNHVRECTQEAKRALDTLVDAGIVVYNQSVLLRAINDDVSAFRKLNRALVHMRATPYYLHQCDVAEGIEHFRTPLAQGLAIIEGLRGHTSGLAVPQLCVDVPGGLGKVTLVPEWVVERRPHATVFRTYTGETAEYPEPTDSYC